MPGGRTAAPLAACLAAALLVVPAFAADGPLVVAARQLADADPGRASVTLQRAGGADAPRRRLAAGALARLTGDFERAEADLARVLAAAVLAGDTPGAVAARIALADLMLELARVGEAQALIAANRKQAIGVLGLEHPLTRASMALEARLELVLEDFETSSFWYERARRGGPGAVVGALDASHFERLTPVLVLAGGVLLDLRRGEIEDARRYAADLRATAAERWGERHPLLAALDRMKAEALAAAGDFAAADALLEDAERRAATSFGEHAPLVAEILAALARVRLLDGRAAEAWPVLERALAIAHERFGRKHPTIRRYKRIARLDGDSRAADLPWLR
ncbi:MAG: hypothetical protein ACU85V_15850 [Gammaproteobacteria bacterium]